MLLFFFLCRPDEGRRSRVLRMSRVDNGLTKVQAFLVSRVRIGVAPATTLMSGLPAGGRRRRICPNRREHTSHREDARLEPSGSAPVCRFWLVEPPGSLLESGQIARCRVLVATLCRPATRRAGCRVCILASRGARRISVSRRCRDACKRQTCHGGGHTLRRVFARNRRRPRACLRNHGTRYVVAAQQRANDVFFAVTGWQSAVHTLR